jgi:hypothetical protein
MKWAVITMISFPLLSGCATLTGQIDKPNEPKSGQKNTEIITPVQETPTDNESASSTNDSPEPSNNASSEQEESMKLLISNLMELAKQGKVINSEFQAKATTIEEVKKEWGEPEKSDWIAAAKGTYATYPKYNLVFGFNKGSQIFEVRSFDPRIQELSLTDIKGAFGTPAYDVKVGGEEIIGYKAGNDYKLLLVFPEPTEEKPNPLLDHYSVLYPRGTVNSMADDAGREW